MKTIIVSLFYLVLFTVASAQLKTTPKCPEFNIDILDGVVNKKIPITSTVGQIKLKFPCFTGFEEEGTSAKCGAGVFYKDKDVYFYTTRDYVEIGPAFKGKLSIPLLGASRDGRRPYGLGLFTTSCARSRAAVVGGGGRLFCVGRPFLWVR